MPDAAPRSRARRLAVALAVAAVIAGGVFLAVGIRPTPAGPDAGRSGA